MRKKYLVIIYSITIFVFFVLYLSLGKNKVYTTQDNVGKKIAEVQLNYFDKDGEFNTQEMAKFKFTLLNFWASWCGPCRRENPNIVSVYKDYHRKGFDILGISLDTDKQKWIDAIAKDGLNWMHVSDLNGWNNKAGKLYAVNAIPHSIILNNEGVIIAKNLNGDELREKVAELLD